MTPTFALFWLAALLIFQFLLWSGMTKQALLFGAVISVVSLFAPWGNLAFGFTAALCLVAARPYVERDFKREQAIRMSLPPPDQVVGQYCVWMGPKER